MYDFNPLSLSSHLSDETFSRLEYKMAAPSTDGEVVVTCEDYLGFQVRLKYLIHEIRM